MLASLAIRNFVLIEDAVLEFEPGLNVLTGETGAGKTLLTRALGLLMGERAEDGLVGRAASEATIQAVFELDDAEVSGLPEEVRDLVGGVDAGEFLVSRRLGKQGRNRCYLNDTAVTLGAMGSAMAGLLSFAGQHEYRRLLDPRYQLEVLDSWAGADVVALGAEFDEAFGRARDATRRLERSRRDKDSRLRDIESLRFQVGELSAAGLSVAEEERLIAEQRVLARADEVVTATLAAATLIANDDEEPDASGLSSLAAAQLTGLDGIDPALDAMAEAARGAQYQLSELARELRGYATRVDVDPGRLETVNERLRLYTDLARKYGGSTDAAVTHLADAAAKLSSLEQTDESQTRLEQVQAEESTRAVELAAALSQRRRQAVPLLEQAIAEQIADLGMMAAKVEIAVQTCLDYPALRETGGDSVEFLLTANPGQPARSLARTASGGELSRVLLAIKCALAGAGGSETLVFDEVDAGIGGRTAVAVGNKLRELSGAAQIVVITHLPQVAALADRHFLIDKASEAGETVTRVYPVTEDAVVAELCRMLGGRPDDAEAMAHARDLRDRAADGLLD